MVSDAHRGKGRRRWLVRSLATAVLALALTVPFGCGAVSSEEPVHLLIKVPRTSHDAVFDDSITEVDQVVTRMAEAFERDHEGAEVNIEVEVFEQNQYDAAVVDAFDTEEAPDVLYGDYFNMSTYIHSGRVVPLDDVIDEEWREDVFEYLWDMSTVDGRVYMMPYLARQNVLAYKKDLFVQAGLERYIQDGVIGSWTLEEWTFILDALATNLPENVYPMMMYAASSQGDTHIMTLLRSAGSSFFDEDGHFALSTPEGIAALRWIQNGVDRGWFPPHSENLEIEACSSLFRQDQLGIYMVNNASIGRYGDTIGLVNFPGPDEEGCATTFVSGFEVFDNGDPRKVQIAKEFLAYVYDDDELLGYAAGALPASHSVAERSADRIPLFDQFMENRRHVVDFTGSNPDTRAVREIFHGVIHDLLMKFVTPEEAAAALDERCNRAIDEGIASSTLHL